MPGAFILSSQFGGTATFSQAIATKGSGVGIDESNQFTVRGASFHFSNNQASIVAVGLYAGQTINLDVDYGATSGIDSISTELWVIERNGALVASNDTAASTDDGSTSTNDPRLSFTAAVTGVYFIAVTQAGNDYVDGTFSFDGGGVDSGDFLLNISFPTLPELHLGTGGSNTVSLLTSQRRFDARGGDDTVSASTVNTRIDGGAGDDQLFGSNGNDILHGSDGDDQLQDFSVSSKDIMFGGDGADNLFGGGGSDELLGGYDNDFLSGGDGNDFQWGDGGGDFLDGGAGSDKLRGGPGSDNLTGGPGGDLLAGGAGIDRANYFDATSGVVINLNLTGPQNTKGSGMDQFASIENLSGSRFNDTLRGTDARNVLDGGDGNDRLVLGDGDDQAFGGNGGDTVLGQSGDDFIFEGQGNDSLAGGGGNDFLGGDAGNDILSGGAGLDHLVGGAGKDTLTGGADQDTFNYNQASDSEPGAVDLITDFSSAQTDRINLFNVFPGTLTFIGSSPFSGTAGEVRVVNLASGLQAILVNLDTNVEAEMRILVDSGTTLAAGDFFL